MALIRPAVPGDVDGIARVHIASWTTTYRGLMPDEVLGHLSFVRRREGWQRSLEQHPQELIVAEAANQIVGFVIYGAERQQDPVYHGELYALYLLERYQKIGLGRSLVSAASEALLRVGISSMLVWVLSVNPARRFYEKLEGHYLRDKPFEMPGVRLQESAYGWLDIRSLIGLE
jgi:ribosomal protein S18 acetylase RimI-like enzyme